MVPFVFTRYHLYFGWVWMLNPVSLQAINSLWKHLSVTGELRWRSVRIATYEARPLSESHTASWSARCCCVRTDTRACLLCCCSPERSRSTRWNKPGEKNHWQRAHQTLTHTSFSCLNCLLVAFFLLSQFLTHCQIVLWYIFSSCKCTKWQSWSE